jgi:hypothetical protein
MQKKSKKIAKLFFGVRKKIKWCRQKVLWVSKKLIDAEKN